MTVTVTGAQPAPELAAPPTSPPEFDPELPVVPEEDPVVTGRTVIYLVDVEIVVCVVVMLNRVLAIFLSRIVSTLLIQSSISSPSKDYLSMYQLALNQWTSTLMASVYFAGN